MKDFGIIDRAVGTGVLDIADLGKAQNTIKERFKLVFMPESGMRDEKKIVTLCLDFEKELENEASAALFMDLIDIGNIYYIPRCLRDRLRDKNIDYLQRFEEMIIGSEIEDFIWRNWISEGYRNHGMV